MAQIDPVVVGIDVSKDKVDVCIRALASQQTYPSSAQGHRKLVALLRKRQLNHGAPLPQRDLPTFSLFDN